MKVSFTASKFSTAQACVKKGCTNSSNYLEKKSISSPTSKKSSGLKISPEGVYMGGLLGLALFAAYLVKRPEKITKTLNKVA